MYKKNKSVFQHRAPRQKSLHLIILFSIFKFKLYFKMAVDCCQLGEVYRKDLILLVVLWAQL